jgi:aminopeptidase N
MEINNFYTMTVYEKGAEVVRMIHTLLGAEAFRKGSDLYFERHDGQAVTCDDFVLAMEDASGVDLEQFRNWYSYAGTPLLLVRDEYDADTEQYRLHIEQTCPATPGQDSKPPFVIPLAMGLLGEAGNLPLRLANSESDTETPDNTHTVLTLDQPSQTFVFEGVGERPVPSLLRGFSAPVRLDYDYSKRDLYTLMSHDGDGFVRWDSAQALATRVIHEVQQQIQDGDPVSVDPLLVDACVNLLTDESLDGAMVADMLMLPGENYLAELASQAGGADVDTIHQARGAVQVAIGQALPDVFLATYQRLASDRPYAPDAEQIAARSLRNTCLEFLASADAGGIDLASEQFSAAGNMTERLGALKVIAVHGDAAVRDKTLDTFYLDWRHEALVVNQWFQVQAIIPDAGALTRVQKLMSHADFDLRNPNKVRALVGVFANQNPINFHRIDGEGYRFLADIIARLNSINPQIASGLLRPLTRWRNYTGRADLMRAQLERLAGLPDLSPDVFEVVTKSLQ